MGETEQASLLGELATARGASGTFSMTDGKIDSGTSIYDRSVKEIRTWLKGVRDAG